jgi:NTE family protein
MIHTGKLSEAVRASISIPGIFNPKVSGNRHLVDGGLTNNLPIEDLPTGAVIASSALRDLSRPIQYHRRVWGINWKKTIIGNSYALIQKMIDIVFSQNEARSVQSRKEILYILSKFDHLDYADFHKYKEFIKAGYVASSTIESFLICEK